jgi:predicted O-methyltransferase YrrM
MSKVWTDVDAYAGEQLGYDDGVLKDVLARCRAAGLPEIAVSAAQGKQLHLTVLSIGARRILEVGTLGGYSAIWMARALPADGKLTTLEIDPHHADVARANIAAAGLSDRVEVKTGPAIDLLPDVEGPVDLTFIDADKQSNADYFAHAVRLSRKGAVIIVDNVVRNGAVTDPKGDERVQGVRRLLDQMRADTRVSATVIQTVGDKGYDGYLMAVVL